MLSAPVAKFNSLLDSINSWSLALLYQYPTFLSWLPSSNLVIYPSLFSGHSLQIWAASMDSSWRVKEHMIKAYRPLDPLPFPRSAQYPVLSLSLRELFQGLPGQELLLMLNKAFPTLQPVDTWSTLHSYSVAFSHIIFIFPLNKCQYTQAQGPKIYIHVLCNGDP